MALFETKNNKSQNSTNAVNIVEAEEKLQAVEKMINDEFCELGKKYSEANKDNLAAEYADGIQTITTKYADAHLWKQYRLTLEEKRICDSCQAIITLDSAFCNKCGTPVSTLDFSSILDTPQPTAAATEKKAFCPKCGKPLVDGASFCDSCGTKIL